jgi:hypothetical protein
MSRHRECLVCCLSRLPTVSEDPELSPTPFIYTAIVVLPADATQLCAPSIMATQPRRGHQRAEEAHCQHWLVHASRVWAALLAGTRWPWAKPRAGGPHPM